MADGSEKARSRAAFLRKRAVEAQKVQKSLLKQDELLESVDLTPSLETKKQSLKIAESLAQTVENDSLPQSVSEVAAAFAESPHHESSFLAMPSEMIADRIESGAFQASKTEADIQQQRYEEKMRALSEINERRAALPIARERENLLSTIKSHQVVVVVGETGCGKTTQLPQYLLSEASGKRIFCTQPRRLAAMSVAERVATEQNTPCGVRVGYKVRFDDRTSEKTELVYLTDGMMLNEMITDPTLEGAAAIMIDEAHERSLSTDLLLGILRDVIRSNKELRIIVASATLVADKFINFFAGANGEGRPVPNLQIKGRTFPVDTFFAQSPQPDHVEAAAIQALTLHYEKPLPGDILIFMPGQEDIERCHEMMTKAIEKEDQSSIRELIVLPVFSSLPVDQQRRIYLPTPEGARKVVIATNIAETSITVEGIVYVIDTGLCKQKVFSPSRNMESLVQTPISLASAEQRKGRAGRTRPGECIRLYTEYTYRNELEQDPAPEILRSSLTSVVLNMKSLGIHDPTRFDFLDAPSPDALSRALGQLFALRAVSTSGKLTKTGRLMAAFPVEPTVARAILDSQNRYSCCREMCKAAAMLSLQNSIFVIPKEKAEMGREVKTKLFNNTSGDVVGLVNVLEQWMESEAKPSFAREHFLNSHALQRAQDVLVQLLGVCSTVFDGELTHTTEFGMRNENITKAFLSGFFFNVAKITLDGESFVLVKSSDRGVRTSARIHPTSCLAMVMFRSDDRRPLFSNLNDVTGRPDFVVFAELRKTTSEFLMYVSSVCPSWIQEASPSGFFKDDELRTELVAGRKRGR